MKKLLVIFITLLSAQSTWAHGVSEEAKEAMIGGGPLDYIWLGAEHMVTGYDHLLFLFGVMFFLTKFKEIVTFITAFTVGHCITLIAATYMGITANYHLVDAIIALTVIYKGFDNIDGFKKYFAKESPNLLVMVFIFGLIHGFGLSTRLQQLPLGEEGFLLRILSFNVGVELGQIAALSIMLVFLTAWRQSPSFKKLSIKANVLLMIAGAGLFFYQLNSMMTENAELHGHDDHSGHNHENCDHEHGAHDHANAQEPNHSNTHQHDHSDEHPDRHEGHTHQETGDR